MASNFPIEPAGWYSPDSVKHFPVTAGQTFLKGALVVYTSDALVECSADPTSVLGIALEPASVGLATAGSIHGGTNIPVLVFTTNMLLKISSATTPAQTLVGDAYGVVKSTNWLLDTSETSADVFVVQDFKTAPEMLIVRPVADVCQFDAIAS